MRIHYLGVMEPLSLCFDPFPVLETPRLRLRRYTSDDAADLFSFRSNALAMHFVPRPLQQSVNDALKMISEIDENINANISIAWAIELTERAQVIGSVSFHRIEKEHHRGELGYMIHPDHWGKGLVTEAAAAAVHYGFTGIGFHSIEAIIDPDNVASANVLEKLRFTKEAHFRENFMDKGRFTDTAVYSKLKRDHLHAMA